MFRTATYTSEAYTRCAAHAWYAYSVPVLFAQTTLCRGRVSLLACRCVGAISAVVILLRLLHGFDIAAITIALDLPRRSNPARCGGSLQMQYVNSASACFREAVLIFHEASS